ncbi:MAG: ScyD/ScyE family protein, partial [Verrucomicrobiota bacterium]|nr:ScyD/ScyE family protein [Verrucomicrobiota bacterium]
MKRHVKNPKNPSITKAVLTTVISAHLLLAGVEAKAQCPVTDLTTGLLRPIGITLSQKDNLLVSESGTSNPNTGRISIVDLKGVRRTLISGLPSGISFEANAPSGPDGLFLRGRTLYVAIGVGDAVIAGPTQGTTAPNPNPSSALFSSILAIHFSAKVEKTTTGFTLTLADQQTLANRTPVTLSNGSRDTITIELIANFPDYAPEPLPSFAGNVRNTNPFDLVAVGNQLFVTDGGRNHVWRVNLATGDYSILTAFPPIPNPLFNPTPPPPSVGRPTSEAVPTGIAYVDGKLLVTLFRGFPFAQGTSVVEQIDPQTGRHGPLITGLKTAIDVLPIKADADDGSATRYLVLQHASGAFLSPPGLLLRFET